MKLNIQPDTLIFGVMIPPISLSNADLTDLYSEVTKSYDYDSFALLNPGARIVNQQNNNEINILPVRIQIVENIKEGQPFQSTKEKVSDIMCKAFLAKFKNRITPNVIVGYGVKLVAKMDLKQGDDAANKFVNNIVNLGPDRLKLLGDVQKLAMGIRFHFFNKSGAQLDIHIEPWLQDFNQLWVDLDAQFPGGPFDMVEQKLEGSIKEIKDYFTKDIGEFLEFWGKS